MIVLFFDFIFWWEQWKEYKITEKNNKAGLNGKGNRWKGNEKEGRKHNGKE